MDKRCTIAFFRLWSKKTSEREYVAYDITSVAFYLEQNEFVRYGCNQEGEPLKPMHLSIVYGRIPSSLADVTSLTNCLDSFDKLNFPKLHLVMERGFYSQSNIDELVSRGHKFTMDVEGVKGWIDEANNVVQGLDEYRRVHEERNEEGVIHSYTSTHKGLVRPMTLIVVVYLRQRGNEHLKSEARKRRTTIEPISS